MGIFSSETEEEKQYRLLIKGIRSSNIDVEVKNTLIENKYTESIKEITKKAKIKKNESIVKKVKF